MSPDSHKGENLSVISTSRDQLPIDGTTPDFVVESADSPDNSAWLQDRIHVLRRHYLWIILFAAATAGLVARQIRQAVPMYRSTATVRFSDSRGNLTSGIGTNAPSQLSWTVDPIKSQTELFSSRATAEAAVDAGNLQVRELTEPGSLGWVSAIDVSRQATRDTLKLRFADSTLTVVVGVASTTARYGDPVKVGSVSFIVASRPPKDTAAFLISPREQAIGTVQGGLRAAPRPQTDIADLSFIGTDPYFAQRALNAATLALQDLSTQTSLLSARARRQFLDQQLRKTNSVLDEKRGQLSSFRTSTQTFSTKDKIAAQQTSLISVRIRGEELRADRDVYASLLSRAQNAAQSGSVDALRGLLAAPGVSSNTAITGAYQQLVELRNARDSLTAGPFAAAATNPDVIRLDGLIQSAGGQLVAAVKSNIEGLNARIVALDAMGSRGAADASSLPQAEAEEARLVEELQGTQRIADQLREEQQRAAISEVAQGGQIQIIDLSRQPGSRVPTGDQRKILLAAVLALLLAVEVSRMLDSLNKTFRETREVEKTLGLPTLGAIPQLSRVSTGPSKRISRLLTLPGFGNWRAAPVSASSSKSLALVDASVPEFESFRALRTSLMFSNAAHSLRSLIITSAAPGDGKSTTAANLAGAFAQQGLRVLAVDCDIRVGRLHKLFGLHRSPGLMDVVLGQVTLTEAIQETGTPNLCLLSAGTNPPNSTELLGSDPVRAILHQLSGQFDLMIIDTPPVLATADAAVLGSMVDGVVLVVRIGVTNRAAAKRAVDRMRAVGARVVGTVLNDPDEILGSREDYYHYQYAYGENASTSAG